MRNEYPTTMAQKLDSSIIIIPSYQPILASVSGSSSSVATPIAANQSIYLLDRVLRRAL
jgi:hypothetical protein